MTSGPFVRHVAGTFMLLSRAPGIPGRVIFVSQWWPAFAAFVGVNKVRIALAKRCLMETIVRKLGARAEA